MASAKKIVNGIEFDADTPEKVVNLILRYLNTDQRIRIFYGDRRTGEDWGDEFEIMGYVRNSAGRTKIPLLVYNKKSFGATGMLTGSIVRITVDKRDVYRHPKYRCDAVAKGNQVYLNGKLFGTLKSHDKAEKTAAFLRGERNTIGGS